MDNVAAAELIENRGIKGNADQKGMRQITIITQENWINMMKELKMNLDPSLRRANVLVRGISLLGTRNRILRLGNCLIHVRGETRPCEQMDEASPGLKKVMQVNWNGGIFGTIVKGGIIKIGNQAVFEETLSVNPV